MSEQGRARSTRDCPLSVVTSRAAELLLQTGTLTEGDLDLAGVCESRDAQFQENVTDPHNLPSDSLLVQTMASCHSLVKIEGDLTGYPMDIKLFEAINWVRLVGSSSWDCLCWS